MAPAGFSDSPAAAAPPPKLTAADVAAALASVSAPAPAAPAAPVSAGAAPAVAGDVDVIEREWVDKAEQVVAAHQGDPYGEEAAVEDLQQDYLAKRYGMNVADSDQQKPAK